MNKGQLIVISGPSGAGKDTVISQLIKRTEKDVFLSVSMTTRKIRSGEQEGVDYFYVDEKTFEKNIQDGKMLEYAKYGSNYYGTPLEPVQTNIENGKTVILIIEVNGAANIRKMFPEATLIFIIPPSMAEVKRRLIKRATESDEQIEKRLKIAEDEIRRATEYDYVIINDELDVAVKDAMSIVHAQQFRADRMKHKISEVIENA